jgi:ABC-2 type transport system ATP-binding protein
MAAPSSVLGVRGLTHAYGERNVLNGLNLDVNPGEIVGLLGPNGSGKSTAFRILAGLLPKQAGEVLWNGDSKAFGSRAWFDTLGIIFQSPSLDIKLTCIQNLRLAASIRGMKGADASEQVEYQLEKAGLSERRDDLVGELSGGFRRRLDVARALLHRPSLLILDEPTVGLDEASFRGTWDRLERARTEDGVSILVATHRPDEAERCDRIAVISNGSIEIVDSPDSLRRKVAEEVIILTGAAPEILMGHLESLAGSLGDSIVSSRVDGVEVHIECTNGHVLIPQLVQGIPRDQIKTVSLRQPSLADVFFKITGQGLWEDLS